MPYKCRIAKEPTGMPRTLHDPKLDTRASRLRLRRRRETFRRLPWEGAGVGYVRGARAAPWTARHYSAEHGRRYNSIGTADDIVDADGAHVISFAQAQEAARKWFADLGRRDRGEI